MAHSAVPYKVCSCALKKSETGQRSNHFLWVGKEGWAGMLLLLRGGALWALASPNTEHLQQGGVTP